MHPTAESSSAVYITPRSQTANRGVRIKNFASLWLLLKGQSLELLLRVNTSIMKEEILSIKGGFTKPKMLTPQSQNFLTLCTNILAKSAPNKKLIKSVHQGPGWVRIMKKIEVENLLTHSLKILEVRYFMMI